MKILWLDLNSSYAHSSLALPALHAQTATNESIEWEIVSATINENIGMVTNSIYHHQPNIIAATNWLFNHEQFAALHWADRNFLVITKPFYGKTALLTASFAEKAKKFFLNG